MRTQPSEETKRKRRFLILLPLLIIPFITMGFWALGGGKGMSDPSNPDRSSGLSAELPDAEFNEQEEKDKFSIYEVLEKKQKKQLKEKKDDVLNSLAFREPTRGKEDTPGALVNEKLQAINRELERQTIEETKHVSTEADNIQSSSQSGLGSDVERLENLMASFQEDASEEKEMAQLNGILDKILQIQNPDPLINGTESVASITTTNTPRVRVADSLDIREYYSALDKVVKSAGNTIHAVIHETADVVSGSVVKLRLSDTIVVDDVLIPKNDFIYGVVSINNERLKINIPSLRYKNSILSVSLSAYDLDGLEGLYIPGTVTRDATKKGVDNALQGVQLLSIDNSLSGQMANAGVRAAKGLFGKKVKQVRVKVKAGYELLLRDNNL